MVGAKNSSEAQGPGPELMQNRGQVESGRLPCVVTGNLPARQSLAQRRQGAAQGWHGRRCTLQAAKPAAKRGGIGHAMGIFHCGRSRFPAAAFHQTPVQGLHASRQTVVRVRGGEGRKQSEGFPAVVAQTAAYPNPVMLFIVSLLAAPTVAADRVVFTNRASSYDDFGASRGPIGYQVVFPGGKWDNENRMTIGDSAMVVTRQDLLTEAESLASLRKSHLEKNNALDWSLGVRTSRD